MFTAAPPHTESSAWRALAASLAAFVPPTTAIALAHVVAAAQRGMICGSTSAQAGHCWACYAAPMLTLAVIACWRLANAAPRPAHARAG